MFFTRTLNKMQVTYVTTDAVGDPRICVPKRMVTMLRETVELVAVVSFTIPLQRNSTAFANMFPNASLCVSSQAQKLQTTEVATFAPGGCQSNAVTVPSFAPPANTYLVAGKPLESSLPSRRDGKPRLWNRSVHPVGDNDLELGDQQAYWLSASLKKKEYARVSTTERVWVLLSIRQGLRYSLLPFERRSSSVAEGATLVFNEEMH